jgi:thiamine transport system permease protein
LRSEILLLLLFVFAICFASFAIPLAIGGSHATTVEVLIYQKIRISGDWGQALGLAFLQMLAVLLLSFFLKNERGTSASFRLVTTPLLSWAPGLVVALLPTVILIVGLLSGVLSGYEELIRTPTLIEDLPRLIAGSVLVGFGSGFLIVILLLLLAYQPPQGWLAKIWTGYAAPSSVLIGFSLLILWRSFGFASYIKIILGLGLVMIPAFYRYEWRAALDSLQGQVLIAQTLGAGPWLIFSRVIYPQVIARACFIGGMAALWAWGDFALSSVLGERTLTLAMAAQQMMGAYRLDGATFVVWILMLGGLATFAIFTGAGYVLGSKPQA